MHTSITFFLVLATILQLILANYDCYKFSDNEFATIKSCPYGCEYEFKMKAGRQEKDDGGCADQRAVEGCRNKGSKTVCVCFSNNCNKLGYDMSPSTSSEERG